MSTEGRRGREGSWHVWVAHPHSTNAPTANTAPTTPVQSKPLGGTATAASQIGNGPDKVALILPLTQNGAPSAVGTSLRNAAELAYAESGSSDLTILVKEDLISRRCTNVGLLTGYHRPSIAFSQPARLHKCRRWVEREGNG